MVGRLIVDGLMVHGWGVNSSWLGINSSWLMVIVNGSWLVVGSLKGMYQMGFS